ncbi:PD40 domain-containing protein [Micromonospora humi]|uniref:WD40-like Beta Propeller Repeat n=1 Tax=Micromonospora humi TaxID=745366 RepID=A0A1C5IBU6_9ACTN|nr:PD40 domain-containing protein [Micromonospora humi]SCG55236.1 WD40-like Beta Propeller Repeat [Micromonospora humi]
MSTSLDETLRTAVRDLADDAVPAPDLAWRALGHGRRLRRRRRVAATATVLAAVVAVTLPIVLLRPRAAPPPTAPPVTAVPSPVIRSAPGANWSNGPLTLPGGWVVTSLNEIAKSNGKSYLLDRARGRYLVNGRYDAVLPAPTGSLVAVWDDDRPRQVGLVDLARGTTRWYEPGRALGAPNWSPDGRRLVFTSQRVDHFGFVVLNAKGASRTHAVDTDEFLCTDHCFFLWSRDGREVLLQQTDPGRPRSESARHPRRGVQFFSADTGRPTRFEPLPGDPAGPWAWSPDGKLVVVQGQREPLLVDAATGRVVNALPAADAVWAGPDRLLYRRPNGSHEFVYADTTGRELVRQPLPEQFRLAEVTIAPG